MENNEIIELKNEINKWRGKFLLVFGYSLGLTISLSTAILIKQL